MQSDVIKRKHIPMIQSVDGLSTRLNNQKFCIDYTTVSYAQFVGREARAV